MHDLDVFERDLGEQFVLSMLTEYIQGNIKEEQIDWTIYSYRRHLVKVMKYCVKVGILEIDDGELLKDVIEKTRHSWTMKEEKCFMKIQVHPDIL